MTVQEMINNFRLEYDRLASLSAPSYESTEIIRFLDKAQLEIVTDLYRSKQWMLIEDLLLTATFTGAGVGTYTLISGAKYVDLTSATTTRYMFYITSYSKMTRTQLPVIGSGTIVQNQDINKDDAKNYASNGFNTAIFRFPKAFMDGGTLGALLTVIPDGYTTITEIYVDYLSQPKYLTTSIVAPQSSDTHATTCQLKEILHDQVVSRAVELALLAVDPQRAAINTKINNTQ